MIKSINRPNVKVRYKLYKRKKKWVVSGISTIAAAGLMVAVQTVANADTVTTTTDSGATPEQSSTGGNAVSQSTAISQSVTVDHSNLDKAVQDAKAAGLNPTQQPTTSQTVTEDQSDQAESQIKSDYDKQTEQINNTTAQYLHDKHNYETYNNYEADHSALDAAVEAAKKVPGLTVTQEQTQEKQVDASNDAEINNWTENTKKDYEEQTKAVTEAANKQQAAYDEWQKNKQEQEAQYNPSKAIRTDTAFVPAVVSYNNSTDVSSSLSGAGHQDGSNYVTWYESSMENKKGLRYVGLDSNSVVKARWKNAAVDPETGENLDFEVTLTDFQKPTNSNGDIYVEIYHDLNSGIGWGGTTAFKTNIVLYKSETNDLYTGYYIVSQDSLDRQLPVDGKGGRAEFVSPKSGVIASYLPADSKVMADEQPVYGTATNLTNKAFYSTGIHAYSDGPQAMIFLSKGVSSYVLGTTNPNGGDATSINWGNGTYIDATFVQLGFGSNSMKVAAPPSGKTEYHDNKLIVRIPTTVKDINYQYHDLNVLSTPHKDVGAGTQSGEVTESTDGKMVPKRSNMTFSLTMPDMPAYRTDDIKSRVTVDHLDPNFGYESLKAFVKDDSGKLQDMTGHVKVTKDGNDLYITEDATLLARYNQDKTKKVSMPIFNLYGTALKDQSKILNTYDIYVNDDKATSNTVTIPTPETPEPVKKDLNDQGVDINGKNLLPGEKPIFEISADYDQYVGINADEVEIDKGFYIIDDYPEEAVTIDPSKVTAKDSQNAPVELEYNVYKSLDEAPDNVKLAVARSGLNIKGAFLVASPKDNKDYFTKYIQTGNSVTITLPAEVKEGYSGKFTNSAYEVDFGNGYATNVVVNIVPKLDPKKDVVVSVDNLTSLDNKDVKLGENIDYRLEGPIIPANQGYPITEYGWDDDYDQEHDQYNGYFVAELTTDVTLKDGTVLKAGTDITKYVTQVIDTKNGAVHFDVDKDFLAKVDTTNSEFGADNFMQVKRIKTGDVENTYTSRINGKKYRSNTVVTHTKEEPKPEPTPCHCDTPKPESEVPETPKAVETPVSTPAVTPVVASVMPESQKQDTPKEAILPQTGDSNSEGLVLTGFAALLLALGNLGFAFKKKKMA